MHNGTCQSYRCGPIEKFWIHKFKIKNCNEEVLKENTWWRKLFIIKLVNHILWTCHEEQVLVIAEAAVNIKLTSSFFPSRHSKCRDTAHPTTTLKMWWYNQTEASHKSYWSKLRHNLACEYVCVVCVCMWVCLCV